MRIPGAPALQWTGPGALGPLAIVESHIDAIIVRGPRIEPRRIVVASAELLAPSGPIVVRRRGPMTSSLVHIIENKLPLHEASVLYILRMAFGEYALQSPQRPCLSQCSNRIALPRPADRRAEWRGKPHVWFTPEYVRL